MAAGFPHISITQERKQLAYECCLLHEVITKRVAALDDIRKGLQSVKLLGNTVLDLLRRWPVLKKKFFPEAKTERVDQEMLVPRIVYIEENPVHRDVRVYFEQYIQDLNARKGMLTCFSLPLKF